MLPREPILNTEEDLSPGRIICFVISHVILALMRMFTPLIAYRFDDDHWPELCNSSANTTNLSHLRIPQLHRFWYACWALYTENELESPSIRLREWGRLQGTRRERLLAARTMRESLSVHTKMYSPEWKGPLSHGRNLKEKVVQRR